MLSRRALVGVAVSLAAAAALLVTLDGHRRATAAPAALGTIKGRVVFDGTPPARAAVDRSQDDVCARNKTPADDVIVGKAKGVKDVLVRLPIGAASGVKAPVKPVVIDQRGCTYTPHVVGVMAGQPLAIRNSDRTLHNVHTYAGDETLFNLGQPAGSKPIEQDPGVAAGGVIRLACDVHPWMEAFAVVSDHPYFMVTGEDGAFVLRVPPGTYQLEAWHPKLGTQKVEVVVKAGKTTSATFTYRAAP